MAMIGPTFGSELIAAGLGGLPIVWTSEGEITGRNALTRDQEIALDAVLSDHDPNARDIAAIDAVRAAAYREEADPLFFKAQRGEALMEDWVDKVTEIKNRYPKP